MIRNVHVFVIKKRKIRNGQKNMIKRVTVMIDSDLDKKIRLVQAKMIQKEKKSVSYSHVVNLLLQNAIKK